jgi:hypothetical protein
MWPDIRRYRETREMSTDELAACYGLAGRLRRYELHSSLDQALRLWMFAAREVLESRGELERVREWLPVYYDPTREVRVFGPGAALTSQAVIEKAIASARPLRQITGGA